MRGVLKIKTRKQKKKGNGVRLNGGRKSGQEIKTKDKGIEGRKKRKGEKTKFMYKILTRYINLKKLLYKNYLIKNRLIRLVCYRKL